MSAEISIFGIFVPSILLCAVIAYATTAVIARGLRATGGYRYVWHQSLFNLSIFVCLLGASVLLFSKVHS
jgi:uncharacterized protein DUF1656